MSIHPQGENNAGYADDYPGRHRDIYDCTFSNLISTWRQRWCGQQEEFGADCGSWQVGGQLYIYIIYIPTYLRIYIIYIIYISTCVSGSSPSASCSWRPTRSRPPTWPGPSSDGDRSPIMCTVQYSTVQYSTVQYSIMCPQ